jgi:hypothetical protein
VPAPDYGDLMGVRVAELVACWLVVLKYGGSNLASSIVSILMSFLSCKAYYPREIVDLELQSDHVGIIQ